MSAAGEHSRPAGSRIDPRQAIRSRRRTARRRTPADRSRGQADPLHQPVLLARPCLDGPAPDRPGRVAGGAGLRVPRACARRAATSRASPGPPAYEIHDGVHIHRVPATSLGRRGTWARMTDYLSFYAGAVVKALLLPAVRRGRHADHAADHRPDRHAAEAAARDAARLLEHGPASRRQPGAGPDVAAAACSAGSMRWLSGFVYRQADQVVVLGPYMADRIALKGVAARADRRRSRSGAVATRSTRCRATPTRCASRSGSSSAFVAMYSGNLGLAHSFDEFLEAARRLRDRADIVFLFVGDGPRLAEVKAARDARRT